MYMKNLFFVLGSQVSKTEFAAMEIQALISLLNQGRRFGVAKPFDDEPYEDAAAHTASSRKLHETTTSAF